MVNPDTVPRSSAVATDTQPSTPGLRGSRSKATKALRSVTLSCALYLLPLAGHIERATELRLWALILLFVAVDWMQPPITKGAEAGQRNYRDAYSMPVVMAAALVSHVAPVIEWGYLQTAQAPRAALVAVGGAMLLLGAVLRLWAMHTLGVFFSGFVVTSDSQALVRAGPYQWLRHPSYTGAGLMLLGATLVLEAPWSLGLSVVLLGAAYTYRIRVEEAALATHFGPQYSSYARSTKRLVPFIW